MVLIILRLNQMLRKTKPPYGNGQSQHTLFMYLNTYIMYDVVFELRNKIITNGHILLFFK